MKKFVALACCVGLVMPGHASSVQSDEARIAPMPPIADRGYCRTPAPLPDLGPEIDRNQQQRDDRRLRRSAGLEAKSDIAPAPVEPMPSVAPPPPPPPPPASSGAVEESGGDTITVTASRIEERTYDSPVAVMSVDSDSVADAGSADEARSLPRPPVDPRPPQPRPQAGLLTAGEHDDLLNPELYEEYRRNANIGQQVQDLPVVDTDRLLTVEVRDRRGRPMPFADVEVLCSDGNSIKLKTVADGSAVFFPELDRLSRKVKIRADGSRWRDVRLSRDPGGQTVTITQTRAAQSVKKLDLALVVDVTGSMSDELRYLQAELTSIIGALEQRHPQLDVRVAFTFYRDKGDEFVTRTYGFDGNVERARGRLGQQRANGGGDYEEAMQDAMVRAAQQDWRDDAVKTLLLVADAPPHNPDIPRTWLAAEHLRGERVHIVPVGASGVADVAEYVMRAMAAVTQSRYTFLTDDSGIGNPHAEPAIDCYLVTRLDHLLRRVIDSQLSGRRIEPDKAEVIRAVGKYDAGRCVLPPNFAKQRADKADQEG